MNVVFEEEVINRGGGDIIKVLGCVGPAGDGGVKERGLEQQEVLVAETQGPDDGDGLQEHGEVRPILPRPVQQLL